MQIYHKYSKKDTYTAIGVMSGTSVDGLDIVAAEFTLENAGWKFIIIKSGTVSFPPGLKNKLLNCMDLSGEQLALLNVEFGKFIGENVAGFCSRETFVPDLIASHGHTVFHQPGNGLTLQIGDGQAIMKQTGVLTVNDFRKMDVMHQGQGAPIVPVGDQLLFPEYDFCLNIGGFANISFDDISGKRLAYDISPANILLNHLARKADLPFDKDGDIARSGEIIPEVLEELNNLAFYSCKGPRSLGLEWVRENILPVFEEDIYPVRNLLRTGIEHIALQIHRVIVREKDNKDPSKYDKVLVTGGGAHNLYLMHRMKSLASSYKYEIPDKQIIDFKEALIFAFLGVLRIRGEVNILRSVTGASRDSCSGTVHDNL